MGIPKEKNQTICQECYSHEKKPLKLGPVINITEISFVLSVIHTRVSGVLQIHLRVLPSQRMTFVPGLVRSTHREHEWRSFSWWWDWLAAGGTGRLTVAMAIQVTPRVWFPSDFVGPSCAEAKGCQSQAEWKTTWKSCVVACTWVQSLQTHFSRNQKPLNTCPVREKVTSLRPHVSLSCCDRRLGQSLPVLPLPHPTAHAWCQQVCNSGVCETCLSAQCFCSGSCVWKYEMAPPKARR